MTDLRSLLKPFRPAIAFTYGLTLTEKACQLAYPALTGVAVDQLLIKNYQGIAILISVWMFHAVLSYFRLRYDTRVFTRIYSEVASTVIVAQQAEGEELSEVSARAELSREIVDFFEHDLPTIAHDFVMILGSLWMLFVYDPFAGAVGCAILVPVLIANKIYASKSARLNRGLNDQIEREVRTLEEASPKYILRHFRLLSRWKVALSDAEATTWLVTEVTTIIALIFILVHYTRGGDASAGSIYAIIAYTYDYLDGLIDVPVVVNNIVRIQDIRERL